MARPGYYKEYYRLNRDKKIADAAEWQQQNSDHRKQYMRAYYESNPSKFPRRTPEQQEVFNKARRDKYKSCEKTRAYVKSKVKEWGRRNPEKLKSQRIKQYGITIEQYNSMFKRQKGLCAICRDDTKLFIDHCHSKGHVRGLLCSSCNFGLGKFRDNRELLKRASLYLRASEKSLDK